MTSRLTRTWIVVVALTLAAMWTAGGADDVQRLGVAGAAAIIAVSALKASVILRNFLELRHAPAGWQIFFYLYLAAIGVIVLAAHAGEAALTSS